MTYTAANAASSRSFGSVGIGIPGREMGERQLAGFLERAEHDDRARRADGRDRAEALLEDAREVVGVGGTALDEIAVLAGDVVDLEHLRDRREALAGSDRVDRVVAADEYEAEQAQLHGLRLETHLVAGDDAVLLELLDALEDGRGRHAELACDLGVRDARVLLQERQDLEVDGVELEHRLPPRQ